MDKQLSKLQEQENRVNKVIEKLKNEYIMLELLHKIFSNISIVLFISAVTLLISGIFGSGEVQLIVCSCFLLIAILLHFINNFIAKRLPDIKENYLLLEDYTLML